jgi:SAM-dependent methyltransferase
VRTLRRRRFPRLKPAEGLATMTPAMEGARNYFAWIYEALAPHLRGTVLEVGSGFGVFSDVLARRHGALVATDYDPRAIDGLARRFAGNARVQVARLDVLDEESVAAVGRERLVDTVCSLNVLEHLEDDVFALENMRRLLRPGGRVVLFVPALEVLYGSLDRLAGHFRRYDRQVLEERFGAAGLRPVSFQFFNMVGALGWYVNGCVIPQMRLDAGAVNGQARIYDRFVVRFASALERWVAPPFGQSIIAVASA